MFILMNTWNSLFCFRLRLIILLLIIHGFSSVFLCCDVSAYFSPSDEVLNVLLGEIDNARNSIDICVYTFTNRKLAFSLIDAKKRGIKVRVILDERSDSNNQFTKGGFLMANGIEVKKISGTKAVRSNDWDGLMHHKFAVIDSNTLITGSLNWTASAITKNHENILILKSCDVIKDYSREFIRLWEKD